jgi:hypothetical protein
LSWGVLSEGCHRSFWWRRFGGSALRGRSALEAIKGIITRERRIDG